MTKLLLEATKKVVLVTRKALRMTHHAHKVKSRKQIILNALRLVFGSTVIYQILMVILSLILINMALYRRASRPTIYEPMPAFSPITPQALEKFGGFPQQIRVGLYIKNFQTFDIIKDTFLLRGTIWFEFDVGIISLDTLKQFMLERSEILQIANPEVKLIDNRMLVRYDVYLRRGSGFNFKGFPLDSHRMDFLLRNTLIAPNEFLFESSRQDFYVTEQTLQFGWEQINRFVRTGYTSIELDERDERKTNYYPVAVFSIEYSRYGIRYALTILLPLLFIFYLMTFALALDYQYRSVSLSLSAGGITAILAYRFVIENLSPSVGYFMLSDYIYFLFLAIALFMFLASLLDIVNKAHYLLGKLLILLAIHAGVIGAMVYILNMTV